MYTQVHLDRDARSELAARFLAALDQHCQVQSTPYAESEAHKLEVAILQDALENGFITEDDFDHAHIELGCIEFDTVHVCVFRPGKDDDDEDTEQWYEVSPVTGVFRGV